MPRVQPLDPTSATGETEIDFPVVPPAAAA